MRLPFRNAFTNTQLRDVTSTASTVSSNEEEPPKVIITESIPGVLKRCVVHIVPIAVSITIMIINIKGTYLGADLMSPVKSETINLLFLQLAAKAHEIMIVASLGVVVLQFVRHELLFGDGLPLGLLGSGLTFNNFEFFFKKEFYGALRYVGARGNKPRKIMFVCLVVASGLVAALAGPASAVLLVPKSQDWEAGGTTFYLNGTEDEFWPSDLSKDISNLRRLCAQNNSTRLGFCPGGGFHSLWTHWGTMNSTIFRTQDVRDYAKDVSGSRFYWPVSSHESLIPPLYTLGTNQQGPNGRTSLIQPHAAAVVVLQKLAEDWWGALVARKHIPSDQVDDRVVSAKFNNAITAGRCGEPQRLWSSNKTVYLPSIDGRFNFANSLPLEVATLNGTSTNYLRFQWVHLPPRFGAASIGAVFESPWETSEMSNASRAVVGCTIQAGWVPATVYTDKYTFWTGWYPWNIIYGDQTPAWASTNDNATNGRIAFDDEWLNLLTPPDPMPAFSTQTWRPSTIESILLNAGLTPNAGTTNESNSGILDRWLGNKNSTWQRISLLEAIVCSVVVDGLSRTGSYRVFDTSNQNSQWSLASYNLLPNFQNLVLNNKPALQPPSTNPDHFTAIRAEMEISGFSFQRSLAGFLAMSVLLSHVAMASAHIIYVVRKRHTSGSWNSVAELIALSQNSQPAFGTLANTGGGIKRSWTFGHVAKIRTKRTPGTSDQEHVELLFDDSSYHQDYKDRRRIGEELDNIHDGFLRHPATWPERRTRISQTNNEDYWNPSTSTERLVPPKYLEGTEKLDFVRPNCVYG